MFFLIQSRYYVKMHLQGKDVNMSYAAISVAVFIIVMIVIISEKIHRAVAAVGGAILLIVMGGYGCGSERIVYRL